MMLDKEDVSTRDGLESMVYALAYFLNGSLPWQGLSYEDDIFEEKLDVTGDELFKNHPDEFKEFMKYVQGLDKNQKPDFEKMIRLFEGCMVKNGIDPKKP